MAASLDVEFRSGVRTVPLTGERLTVGRSELADISARGDVTLSRVHAVFERVAGEWTVRDVGSRNGTFIAGRRLTGSHVLRAGEEVQAGSLRIVLRDDGAVGAGTQTADVGVPHPRTLTIAFTDIEGSTMEAERLGDRRWVEVVAEHEGMLRRHAVASGGWEVKSQGDGLMLAFPSAGGAVDFAVAAQRDLAGRAHRLNVRIGLHTGEAISHEEDLLGHAVIVAARIAASCAGGQIAVSDTVRHLVGHRADLTFDEGRQVALKGIRQPQRIHLVDWGDPRGPGLSTERGPVPP